MGNVEMHDLAPVRDDERKELNLSRKVSHKQFLKHINGEMAEVCLTELPWNIRDSVSLYERMDISFNAVTELPVELPLRLPHLSSVNLSYNLLLALPESFGLLFHLHTLNLSHNKLKELPNSFSHLIKLEKLDISHNNIKELPEDIGKLEALSRLNVSNNKLKTLPNSLGALHNLSVILAKNNRLLSPPQNVCNEGSQAILSFLHKNCPNGTTMTVKSKFNIFPRVRGNQLQSACPNANSAQAQYIMIQTYTNNATSRIKTPLMPPLNATKFDAEELRDHIVGLIYGAAIGDAIGIATTKMSPDECAFHYDPETMTYGDIVRDEHRAHWRQGDWTDNFDQLCLVLESLTHWGGVVDELDFAARLSHWYTSGFKELGDYEGYATSTTIQQVLKCDGYLQDPHSTAKQLLEARHKAPSQASLYSDNGALARALILGVPHFHDLGEVTSNSVRICKSTHSDPMCVSSAVMLSNMVAMILTGMYLQGCAVQTESGRDHLLQQSLSWAECCLPHDALAKDLQQAVAVNTYQEVDIHEEGKEDHALKTLSVAMLALKKNQDFRSTVSEVAMLGAESSTHCSVVGGLLGCRDGFTALPTTWVDGLRKRQTDWLNIKINLLLDMMGIP